MDPAGVPPSDLVQPADPSWCVPGEPFPWDEEGLPWVAWQVAPWDQRDQVLVAWGQKDPWDQVLAALAVVEVAFRKDFDH